MKIETKKDKNFLQHDFTAPWESKISYDKWCDFLKHNFIDPSREEIYKFFNQYLKITPEHPNKSFLEIGFGQCFDFNNCFKNFHDSAIIDYTGWDITSQFVKFAIKKYNEDYFLNNNVTSINYKFNCGGFYELTTNKEKFDIIYTRHTLEHQHPSNCYVFFEALLKAATELLVICWFQPPDEERFSWNNRDGFNHEGAYVNKYSKDKLTKLIKDYNWNCKIIKTGPPANETYILTK